MATSLAGASSRSMLSGVLALPPSLRRSVYTAVAAAAASSSTKSPELYDLVCIGGGPAGLSLISALRSNAATKDLKIALVDGQPLHPSPSQSTDPTSFSNRCSSLTPSSVRFLSHNGAWTHINAARTQPYHSMDVWDGVSGSKIHFDPLDNAQTSILDTLAAAIPGSRLRQSRRKYEQEDISTVATMCENTNLTTALLGRLQAVSAVDIIDKTRVDSIEYGPEPQDDESLDLSQWPIVNLPGDRSLAARLLVGADGANSPVREFANIPSHGWDYGQHGVVATLDVDRRFSQADLRTAYQRFLPTGPIALLPLPGNKASLVWSITAPLAARLKSLSSRDFTAMVNAAFRLMMVDINYLLKNTHADAADELSWREPNTDPRATGLPATLPRVIGVQEGTIASFPLRMRHADTYTGHRVALIGDAAHTVHPLAGQGLNLGLADAEVLANCIAKGVDHGMDIGSCWALDEYNSQRWAANNAMLGVVDKLQKLYSVGSGPIVWGRSFGLDLVNKLGPLKGALMGAAAHS